MEYNTKWLDLLKRCFFVAMIFFNFNSSHLNSLECASMNNQECRTRTKVITINNIEPVFYPFSIKVNKCSGSCNNINDPWNKDGMKINVGVNVEKN